MPLYTFYPCKPDGSSDTFVCFDLPDDDEAFVRGLHLLDQHPTSSHIAALCGERKVFVRARLHADLRSALETSRTRQKG